MKKFKIKSITENNYIIEDDVGDEYKINIKFYNVTEPPVINEYIFFSEKLLDKLANEGVQHFSFGGLYEVYGKHITKRKY